MAQSCDLLVVVGGVIGTSLAYALARRRAGRVVLLEKSFLGAGASGKSGAIVRQHYSNALTVSMAQKSLRFFEHFADIVGGPPVFTQTGMVIVINQRDRPGLEANLALQRGLGVDVRLVSAQELLDIDPRARLADNELAAFESEAGYVEAVQVVASFADAARREGADVYEGVEVKSLIVENGKVAGAETSAGRYLSRTVVLATGPWAARLAAGVGLRLPVQPSRTQVALFRQPTELGTGPVYGDFVQGIYFKPTHGEMVHAGSLAGEEVRSPVDPDYYDESADGSWLPDIRRRLGQRYPALLRGYGRGGYGALYGITPDWHPILDRLPGIEGAYCAVGFSGHGFKLSPIVGQLMAEIVIDGRAATLDITPLRLARFAENDPVKTPYAYGVMG
jgi:glycine/D-amino acid oxidase-like deaminating enzyme